MNNLDLIRALATVPEKRLRLLGGRLTYWQAYLELETMGLRTVPVTPEGVARLLGIKEEKLLAIPKAA